MSSQLTASDHHHNFIPLRTFHPQNRTPTNSHLHPNPHPLSLHRAQNSQRSDHPHQRPKIPRRTPLLHLAIRNYGCQVEHPILHSRIRHFRARLVSCLRRLDPRAYQPWICTWWHRRGCFPYQTNREFLAVR